MASVGAWSDARVFLRRLRLGRSDVAVHAGAIGRHVGLTAVASGRRCAGKVPVLILRFSIR